MQKRRALQVGLLLLSMILIFALAACGGGSETTTKPEENASTDTTTEDTTKNEDTQQAEEPKEPIKIGVLTTKTGILEAYGNQMLKGFYIGLDYATNGTREINGHPIEVIEKDTQTDAQVAVQKATELFEDDNIDILVGSASSGDTLAVLPLAEAYQKIMIVEPAVADSITGSEWNPYVFRTGRNSSQDAVAGAAAIASAGTRIAILAPNYAFGLDGAAAFKEAAEALGAEIVLEEYPAPDATDFTANIQKVIDADPDYLFVIWAGANAPWRAINDMGVADRGITVSTGAPDIAALSTMENLLGMEGFTVYHHTLPKNAVNDFLVEEHQKRHDGEMPDLFTPGGMASAIAAVEALKRSNGATDAETLIGVMEGMEFESPKGKMTFRAEDHQALQPMYAIRLEKVDGFDYPVPVLIRELSAEETAPPVRNSR
jgi:branched-chain amino acid transport system substrate-binding protein